MPLQKFDDAFRLDKFRDLFKEEKKDSTADSAKVKKYGDKKPAAKQAAPKPSDNIVINTDDIMKRLERISPGFGSQNTPYVIQKDDKTLVYYMSNHAEGKWAMYRTTIQPFEDNKTEKVNDGDVYGFDIAAAGDKYYALANSNIYKLNTDNNKIDKIDIDYTFDRNLESEFKQMFDEAWAGLDENYYDGNFHGTEWKKMHGPLQRLPALP